MEGTRILRRSLVLSPRGACSLITTKVSCLLAIASLRTMMIRHAAAVRRVLAQGRKASRAFHASSAILSGDALDMTDTFARRHGTWSALRFDLLWFRGALH